MEGFEVAIRRFMAVSLVLAAQCVGVPSVFASPEDDRVRQLEDRLRALEDRLEQSESVIATQREALGVKGGADVKQGSAIDTFFQTTQVNGSITTSYAYNFKSQDVNTGTQTLNQFNLNNNELSLDAIKLELGKPTAEAGTTGYQLDLLFGRNAGILSAGSALFDPVTTADAASDTEIFFQEAYLAYKLTDALELKAGKFETPLGFEVLDSNDNPNVTHGLLFTFAIPLFHTGVTLGGPLSEEVSWLVGVTNGFNNTRELGDNKGLLGRLAYASGPVSTSLNVYYGTLGETRTSTAGQTVGDDEATTLINDFIFQYTPSDSFTTWLNVDYGLTNRRRASTGAIFNDQGTDPTFFGAAVGFKQKLSDSLYFAFRGEYFNDDNSSRLGPLFSTTAATPGQFDFDEINIYTLTFTLGYQISPSLLGRLEVRRDRVDCDDSSCAPFPDKAIGGNQTSDFGIVELIYSFD